MCVGPNFFLAFTRHCQTPFSLAITHLLRIQLIILVIVVAVCIPIVIVVVVFILFCILLFLYLLPADAENFWLRNIEFVTAQSNFSDCFT